MNLSATISTHLLPVFFVYGLAFFSLGLAASLQHTEGSSFELGDFLHSLALFGFLHGMSEWADMFAALGDQFWTHLGTRIISVTGFFLGLVSFVFLLDFGISAVTSALAKAKALRVSSRIASLAFVALVIALGISDRMSNEWVLITNVLTRYVVAFPAAILTAVGFALHSRCSQKNPVSSGKVRRSMLSMAVCFGVYAFLAGCVVPAAGFPPASWLNYTSFIHAVGLPVQIFRAGCAIWAAIVVHGVLSVFSLESKTRLEAALEATRQSRENLEVRVTERTAELAEAIELLETEVQKRSRLEAEARKAREAADEANRAKSEFLANMSHEIRTPLNGVIGMVELSLDTHLTSEQRDYLDSAKGSADGLLTVINDILDFSRIEARKLELDPIKFSLRDSLGAAVETLALRAEQKGLELAYHIADEIPYELIGDAGRLRQVILNIVGNAIKFTSEGEVVVRIAVEARTEDQALLHFIVKDTGIGVAKEKQSAIFEAFRQADNSTTRVYGGTGLGLAISSQLVALMGGRLWVNSEPGKGSEFHFTASFGIPEETSARPAIRGLLNLADLPVLVVDDNATNRWILHDILSHWHMKPVTNENGIEALATLDEARAAGSPFPLIIVDRNMPEMDGFAVVESIRRHPQFSEATIMMLTSAGKQEDIRRCKELGVAAYLTKPVQQSALLNAIVTAMEGPPVTTISQPIAANAVLRDERPPLRVLLADDNVVNQKLARRVLEKRRCQVETTINGIGVLRALESMTFDIILMDIQMPEMDGFEATVAIRKTERLTGEHVPIIALTAHAMSGDRERCLAAGMDGYISKPIQPTALFAAIDNLLPPPSQNRKAPQLADQDPVVDEVSLRDRVDNDEQLLYELVELFRVDCPTWLQQIGEAIAAGSPRDLEMAAHGFKGAIGTFAAKSAFDAAARLESMGRDNRMDGATQAHATLEIEINRLRLALDAITVKSLGASAR